MNDASEKVAARASDGSCVAAYHRAAWDATRMTSGLYFYKLEVTKKPDNGRSLTLSRKVVLVKSHNHNCVPRGTRAT